MGVSLSDYHAMRERLEKSARKTPGAVPFKQEIANAAPGKRIRQGEKPPNKLEAGWRRHMEAIEPTVKFRAQAIRFRLANGAWYKPDLMAWMNGLLYCWETKGPKQAKNVARGILTIKFAATAWPEVTFILVWRENGEWKTQKILP